jgi:hypothetical protein
MKQLLATPGLANSRMTTKLFVHLLNNIFPRGTVTYSNAATGQTQNVGSNYAGGLKDYGYEIYRIVISDSNVNNIIRTKFYWSKGWFKSY